MTSTRHQGDRERQREKEKETETERKREREGGRIVLFAILFSLRM